MEPRTRAALEEAGAKVENLTSQIRVLTGALNDLGRQEQSARQMATLAARRARTQGLIEEYLRSSPQDSTDLQSKAQRAPHGAEAEIEELEARVDTQLEQERLEGALDLIGADMTTLARELALEHSEDGQVGLRLTQTTLTITTLAGRTFPPRSIGGGGTEWAITSLRTWRSIASCASVIGRHQHSYRWTSRPGRFTQTTCRSVKSLNLRTRATRPSSTLYSALSEKSLTTLTEHCRSWLPTTPSSTASRGSTTLSSRIGADGHGRFRTSGSTEADERRRPWLF